MLLYDEVTALAEDEDDGSVVTAVKSEEGTEVYFETPLSVDAETPELPKTEEYWMGLETAGSTEVVADAVDSISVEGKC